MANVKVSELPVITDLADTDTVYVVEDANGTDESKQITGADLKASVVADHEGAADPHAGTYSSSPHALGGADHSADTLANLNAIVTDATLDDASDTRTPASHGDEAHSTAYVAPGDDAATLGSGAAADGHVLTADGAGGATFAEAAAGGGGLFGNEGVGVPGWAWTEGYNSTNTPPAGWLIYHPLATDTPITIVALEVNVFVAVAGANTQVAIYAANNLWQPVGAPLVQTGDIDASSTGRKRVTGLSVGLEPGRHILVHQSSHAVEFRRWVGLPPQQAMSVLNSVTNNFANWRRFVNTSYGAFPTDPAAGAGWADTTAAARIITTALVEWTMT